MCADGFGILIAYKVDIEELSVLPNGLAGLPGHGRRNNSIGLSVLAASWQSLIKKTSRSLLLRSSSRSGALTIGGLRQYVCVQQYVPLLVGLQRAM